VTRCVQTFFKFVPLLGGNDARDQVERDQAFVTGPAFILVTIDGKRDAHSAENHLRFFTPIGHHVARLARQPFVVDLVVVPYLFAATEELVRQARVHLVEFLHSLSPETHQATHGATLSVTVT
jgi:hypothetical protein